MKAIEVHMETRDVQRMLDRLLDKVQRPRPLLTQVSRYVHAITVKMFRGPRPDRAPVRGVSWPKLATATEWGKRAARARGDALQTRPLVRTGRMRDSLKVLQWTARGFIYGTRVWSKDGYPYPQIHNMGGGNVPARPWLFLRKDDYAKISQLTVDYLKGKLGSLTGKQP